MKEKVEKIIIILEKKFGRPTTALNWKTPFELLIATILSAQCTDKRVNIVTEKLFENYNKPEDFRDVPIETLEELVRTTGFYKNKAKNIKICATQLLEKHNGEVPSNIEQLVSLAGVGRKTANVILGHVFHIPGVVVDTHVKRLAKRIGLTKSDVPEKVENDLMKIVQEKDWTLFSDLLILHGRDKCQARKPICLACEIREFCDYFRMDYKIDR